MLNSIVQFIKGFGLVGNYFQPKPYEKLDNDFVNLIPTEITYEIFSYLNSKELTRCFRVNKKWKLLANADTNILPLRIAFGKKQWKTYFGDIGEEPPLPKDIRKILKSPCPIWSGKTVEQTHMLVLIPKSINGNPLTLKTLGQFVRDPKEGLGNQYRSIWDEIINEYGNQETAKSHWVLMTKNVIEGSRNKSYTDQQALITDLAKKAGIDYEVPNVLDAAICIFMHYIYFRERLFNTKSDSWNSIPTITYTSCQESVQGYRIVIGGFAHNGLVVIPYDSDHDDVGVAAMWKLF